jgi:hypothetical protein
MGASNYVFVQARPSEKIADWIGAHVDLFAFLGTCWQGIESSTKKF